MDDSAKETKKKVNGDAITKVDSYRAIGIARKFFEQYHTGVEIKDMELEDGVWFVTVGVGFLFEQIRKIEIDAYTGRILRYR
ncbi:MAG: hypothetical protein ACHQW9_00540 [Nitrososphaerales archaeon]|jgi:uncharacterized membrane protein YkoI